MRWLPFASTIFWKSWANRAIAVSLGCFAGFAAIASTPADIVAFVPVIVIVATKYTLATGGFVSSVSAMFLRVMSQNFGTDASGNQIVAAIGTAPAGTSPNPPVVVALPRQADPPNVPTTTPADIKAVAER